MEGPEKDISMEEVREALKKMKKEKAEGPSEVSSDWFKALEVDGVEWLTEVINKAWKAEEIPTDWKESTLIPIYKGKGNIMDCGNYRGIKLLEHTMKIYEKVLDNRLRQLVDIDAMQFGFMPGRGTTDAIFIMRQMQEKCLEGNNRLFTAFVDLEKAYDRIPREVIIWALRKRGITEKVVRVVQSLYHECITSVQCGEGTSDPFPVEVGLHQGSALSPFLFAMIMDTISADTREGVPLELLFADDLAVSAASEEGLQERVWTWQEELEKKGMKMNCRKTEVMVTAKEDGMALEVKARSGVVIKQVKNFSYLGSVIESGGGCREEVQARIKKAWNKWREVIGVVCDKRMPIYLRSKI